MTPQLPITTFMRFDKIWVGSSENNFCLWNSFIFRPSLCLWQLIKDLRKCVPTRLSLCCIQDVHFNVIILLSVHVISYWSINKTTFVRRSDYFYLIIAIFNTCPVITLLCFINIKTKPLSHFLAGVISCGHLKIQYFTPRDTKVISLKYLQYISPYKNYLGHLSTDFIEIYIYMYI